MQKISIKFSIFFLVYFLINSCNKTLYQTNWQAAPLKVDGSLEEWKLPLRFYDRDSKLQYAVTNDLNNIYLFVKVTDDQAIIKLLHSGMTIWIDTTGKNKKQVGIEYPMHKQIKMERSEESQPNEEKTGQHDVTRMKKKMVSTQNEMSLTGFIGQINGVFSIMNTELTNKGFDVNMALDESGSLIYEAVIPFKTFMNKPFCIADSNRVFGITFRIDPPPLPENKEHGADYTGGGQHGGGSGMGGPGGMSGGGMRGGGSHSGYKGNTTEPIKLATRFRLSIKNKNP